ncbi:MAG TPA: S8 family serine peptidase [Pyrinomonadaceae bacterium]
MSDKLNVLDTPDLLVKLRPSSVHKIFGSRLTIEPLFDRPPVSLPFGVSPESEWFSVRVPDGAETPWDLAHSRIADQLGVDESDIVFAEPDILHDIYKDDSEASTRTAFAADDDCHSKTDQDGRNGKAVEQGFAWHLGDAFSQLASARDAVQFSDRRTRIAHLDTGYFSGHVCKPKHILKDLERNFVKGDENSSSSEDPNNNRFLMDNSGHGTGTLGILAGGPSPNDGGTILGGAPEADVLPLRIADSVVLLRTSAFAKALQYAIDNGCDVVTMSMGGLPSDLWNEMVNKAYLLGVCVVAAAGNNWKKTPTRNLVYPARYDRVVAACGVMANGRPYAKLGGTAFEGNYGPDSRMRSAIAAYTPNIPWPVYPCETKVRLNGEGTSAATPQVAAAAALWLEKYKGQLQKDWRRVEAVRNALFSTAALDQQFREFYGNGILKAANALNVRPAMNLPQTAPNSDSFAFLRVITGLGVTEITPRERMFNLEIAQLWFRSQGLQELAPEPEDVDQLDEDDLKELMEQLIDEPRASYALRRHIAQRYSVVIGTNPPRTPQREQIVPETAAACNADSTPDSPSHRQLRVYAVDPSLSTNLDTAEINEATLSVRWEELAPGQLKGEYLEVDDLDPTGKKYVSADLNDPRLIAQDGYPPSEGNPQFHQQMVYAVAMKTIEHFERSLGRPVLWRSGYDTNRKVDDKVFVPRLLVRPHALHQANAFYSPVEIALKFGYFEATDRDPHEIVPGSRIFTCLSHDIIAHETTHAILDGLHRRFNEPSNPDVLALHEGFADIVALMQHFTLPEVLRAEIARTRGDIEAESMLGSLAVQFGRGLGHRGALRGAIGYEKDGVWVRITPDPSELAKRLTPHSRGAILVAAVFDAFIAIYKARTADLLRIYTGGTGILPSGAIHPDLVNRLAEEATKSASHVLNMCIRALDYLPPVDVTFFEYLRALITADFDLIRDDRHNYRVAFVEAFRRRGIYPVNIEDPTSDSLRNLSVDTVRWKGQDMTQFSEFADQYTAIWKELKAYADNCLYVQERETLFDMTRKKRIVLHNKLKSAFDKSKKLAQQLGIDPGEKFEVHALRPSMRVSPSGEYSPQVVVSITQSRVIPANAKTETPEFLFRSGSTLIIDLVEQRVKYKIIKNLKSSERQQRTAEFHRMVASDPLRALMLGMNEEEPFALLHQL